MEFLTHWATASVRISASFFGDIDMPTLVSFWEYQIVEHDEENVTNLMFSNVNDSSDSV